MKVRSTLEDNLDAALRSIKKTISDLPKLIALPEYFSVPNSMENFVSAAKIYEETYEPTIHFLATASKLLPQGLLVGGTVLEKVENAFFNTCTVWKNGSLVARYQKRNPVAIEKRVGVRGGNKPLVLETEQCKVGLLVCADMFDNLAIEETVKLGAELLVLPVAAMGTHPSVKGHPLTERIASENGVFVAKVGNVSSSLRGGRSAVISPWGVLCEASETLRDTVISVDLDMERLRNYREILSKA
jgi:predicted amidohydrolase